MRARAQDVDCRGTDGYHALICPIFHVTESRMMIMIIRTLNPKKSVVTTDEASAAWSCCSETPRFDGSGAAGDETKEIREPETFRRECFATLRIGSSSYIQNLTMFLLESRASTLTGSFFKNLLSYRTDSLGEN